MRIEWLNKKGSGRVIVFFHGWGMDAAGVSHLQMEDDVLMCYDYRSLDFDFPDLSHLMELHVRSTMNMEFRSKFMSLQKKG